MSKWIEFMPIENVGRLTKRFAVVSKDQQSTLGYVQWYGAWRCYAFFPSANCVFEKTCLKDITAFIENIMYERKLEKAGL